MLTQQLPPTPIDFEFDIFRIPVHVSGWFWILPVIIGARDGHPLFILIAALVIFIAILVHEMGHALMMRRFGTSPRIALTAFGGYATEDHRDVWNLPGQFATGRKNANQQIMIFFAGPLAGFCLAALTVGILIACGGWIYPYLLYNFIPLWHIELVKGQPFTGDFFNGMAGFPTNRDLLFSLVHLTLFVNIWWGILNLMPVFPLDGGQIAREVMMKSDPHRGLRNSLWLSVFAGGALAIIGVFLLKMFFMGIMFGIFAYQSWETIQRIDGKGFGSGPW